MKQHLLKEIELGTKSALLKKKIITHYIYNGAFDGIRKATIHPYKLSFCVDHSSPLVSRQRRCEAHPISDKNQRGEDNTCLL